MSNYSEDWAKDTFLSKWHPVVRWLLFMPLALVIAIVVPALLYLLNISDTTDGQMAVPGSLVDTILRLIQSAAFGGLFVYIGAIVAPKHQFAIAICQLILVALFAGAVIVLAFTFESSYPIWVSVLNALSAAAAGAGIVYLFYESIKEEAS